MVSLGDTQSQVEATPHWQNDLDCSAEGIRTLSLKVSGITEASKQTSELGEIVRTTAKVLIGNDSSMKESQKQLMGTLDSADGRQTELMKTLLEGGHNCKNLVRVMFDLFQRMDGIFDLKGRNGAGSNVKFDAKFIQPEIGRIELCVQKLRQTYQRLSSISDPEKQEALQEAIQEACDKIVSSDILNESRYAWTKLQEFEEEKKKALATRSQKEYEVQTKRADKKFWEEQVRQASEDEDSLKARLERRKTDLRDFREKVHRSKEDFIASCQAKLKDLEDSLEELKKNEEDHQRRSRAPVEACEALLQEKRDQLVQLDEYNINHIIMALDNSVSMTASTGGLRGLTRFQNALKAVDVFRKPLVSRGSQDRMSVGVFNTEAKCLARSVPVTCSVLEDLRKEGCKGGTRFEAAWKMIEERANSDPKYARLVIVFLSDGLSDDIHTAAKKAKELHEACEKQKRSMCSFFVHIGDEGSTDNVHLQPLVRAANGGQDFLDVAGEQVPLLQLVKAEDLARVFETLTNLVNQQKCILEARITSLREQERESREMYAAQISAYKKHCKEKAKELEEAKHVAGKASKKDKEELERMYEQFDNDLENEVQQLKAEIKVAAGTTLGLTQKLNKCSSDLELLEEDAKHTQQTTVKFLEQLEGLSQDHVATMEQIRDKQKNLSERFGTTNEKLLMQQLESLQKMKYQVKRNCMLEQDLRCMVDTIVLFCDSLKEQIAHPLPGGTAKISKAKVALKILLKQRGLTYKGVPQEDMRQLLKYEAEMQGDDPEEALQRIVKADVRAEELCLAVNEHDPEKVVEIKDNLVKAFEKKFFELDGCDSEAVQEKIRKKTKELRKKKEEIVKKQEELKDAHAKTSSSNTSTTSEEDQDWELVQSDLKEEMDDLQDQEKSLEDELKELEGELKDIKKEQQDLCKDLKPCSGLLKLAVDSCREAFLEHIAEEEKAALLSIMASFKTNVAEAVGALCSMSEQARQAYAPESPVLVDAAHPNFALQDAKTVE